MWIVLPLIFVMAWRFCRRIGQAFNETAAWVVGYLATSGVILALDHGGTGLFSATPTDPVAIVPLLAGFVGMAISHYRWKRRGGHLQPRRGLASSQSKWLRAARAMAGPASSSKTNTTTATAATRQSTGTASAAAQPTTPTPKPAPAPAPPRTSSQSGTTSAARTSPSSRARPAARTNAQKRSANRWVRVVDAMLDTDRNKPPAKR